MKRFDLRILWGGLLILAGGLFLLQELNMIPSAWDFIWALLFGVAGFVFLYAFWTDRSHWWPLIPGMGLLSLGLLIIADEYFPAAGWTGAVFLAGIGISFWLIFALNRENWWAIIPGGVLVTLAFVVGLEPLMSEDAGGGVFLIGLGMTFFLVGLLPTSQGNLRWAFIPAAVLLIIGIILLSSFMAIFNYIWPIVLIILGAYFILKNFRSN